MNVYIVATGERGEGGRNVAIFSREKEAIKFAMVKHRTENNWHGGCDWLTIYRHKVSDSAEEALEEINN